MADLQELDWKELNCNPFTLIGSDWMLVTAGDETKSNTMTASWGGVGYLWGRPASFIFIRPQRYTKELIDAKNEYSLCFFDDSYRPALSFCGSKSGRDVDKAKETGLTLAFEGGVPYWKEARLVLVCKKLYRQEMTPESFLEAGLVEKNYPNSDFHTTYVGEISKVLARK